MTGHDEDARCRDLFARLSEYLDGEVDAGARAAIALHMEGCAPCVALLESLRRTIALLGRDPGRRLPDDLRRACLEAGGSADDEDER